MRHIYTSLDIGTDTIKVVVTELYQNKLNLLAASSYKSMGIKRGLITDVEQAKKCIKQAIEEAENMLGIKINKVIASIPGYNTSFKIVKSSINLNPEEYISSKTVLKVLEKGAKENIDKERELVTILPVDYILDNTAYIKNPVNMRGRNLSARSILVTSPKKNVYSVISLLENIGLEVVDISLNSIGDLYSFNNSQFDDKVGVIINIGCETTNIGLYNKGILVKNSILNMGGKNVEHDIAYIYKTDLPTATKLKMKFALAHTKNANENEIMEIKTTQTNNLKINQFELSEVVQSRLEEILNEAKKEINVLTSHKIDYIIITGGTTNMIDFEYTAKDVFGQDAHIGNVKVLGLRNNKYSACIGNVVYFLSKLKLKNLDYTMINEDDEYELTSVSSRRTNTSDSMLGKIFGFFFSE